MCHGRVNDELSRVSVGTARLEGRLDLGENAQFLCHVQVLKFRKILGTELQKGDQHEVLIPQVCMEGEPTQGWRGMVKGLHDGIGSRRGFYFLGPSKEFRNKAIQQQGWPAWQLRWAILNEPSTSSKDSLRSNFSCPVLWVHWPSSCKIRRIRLDERPRKNEKLAEIHSLKSSGFEITPLTGRVHVCK